MVTVRFIEHDGNEIAVDAKEGASLMEAAVQNGVGGILAECGGACTCATCHVYIDPAWAERVGPAEGDEVEMLTLAVDPEPHSRLSCQVKVDAGLDGVVVHIPAAQF
jgi:ferredoxin, 2Fe-2S